MSSVYFENIQKYLLQYSSLINSSNSLGLTDKTVEAENIFMSLLNLAFGWNVKNANEKNSNQDSFDLANESRGLYIQVTSNKKHSQKHKTAKDSFIKQYKGRKKKQFYILFISPKCSPSILKEEVIGNITCECFDLAKLQKRIYYENPDPSKLEAINCLLQKIVQPVLIAFGKGENKAEQALIDQHIPPLKDSGLYVKRARLVNQVLNFIQADNGLLIGGHGYGKSFLLEELQRLCKSDGIPCVIIRINELINGNDESIAQELNIKTRWLDALLAQPIKHTNKHAVLIFDAFDTAKDEQLKLTLLKQIQKAIRTLNPQWHILVSVRSFDATKSPQLHEMFPVQDIRKDIGCRHIEIPKLTPEELIEAVAANQRINTIYQKANNELKELFRIPYFLALLNQVLQQDKELAITDVAQIETEEQLLSFYWRAKVGNSTAAAVFLQNLTISLADNESLSIEKVTILTETNSYLFDELCSKGVIQEVSVTGRRIAYTHNILLDYAMSRYLIPENALQLVDFVKGHERMPFVFRQSFIYFYNKLWKEYPLTFWMHHSLVKQVNIPLFRLFHQTILNYVVAEFYNTTQDLLPLLQQSDKEENGQAIKKLLEAVRFTNKGNIRNKDYELLLFASKHLHWSFVWELAFQISIAIKSLKTEASKDDRRWKLLSEAACNYWQYVLTERLRDKTHKVIIESNSQWGVDNLCEVYKFNKPVAKKLIEETFLLLHEEDFPIPLFLSLSDKLEQLFAVDSILGIKVFKKLYHHQENSSKQTTFGGGIVALKSNRIQDFHLIHHKLETVFPVLLDLYPDKVLPLGIFMLNQYSKDTYWKHYSNTVYNLNVNDIDTYFTLDGSHEDIIDDRESGPASFGASIFRWLDKLVQTKNVELLEYSVNIFIKQAHTCNAWRRLIRLLIQFPQTLTGTAYSLLCNEAIFMCHETSEEAGALLTAIWPYLKVARKRILEKCILNLKEKILDEESIKYQNRRISRLLNCIPINKVVLAASKKFIEDNEPVVNKPLYRGVVAADIVPHTMEENMQYAGFDPSVKEELSAYDTLKTVEDFNKKFRDKNVAQLQKEDFDQMFPILKLFFEKAQKEKWINDRQRFSHDIALANAIKLCLKSQIKFSKTQQQFFKEVIIFYLSNPAYQKTKYDNGNTSTLRGYSSNPRIEVAEAATHLLYKSKTTELSSSLLALTGDNDSFVRLYSMNAITWYWHHQRPSYWHAILHRSAVEKDGFCLSEIIKGVFYNNIISENIASSEQVAQNLLPIFLSLSGNDASDLWANYISLLLHLCIYHNSNVAMNILLDNLGNKHLSNRLTASIIKILDPHNIKNKQVNYLNKHAPLIKLLSSVVNYRFDALDKKGLTGDDLKDDFEIIDICVRELYFAMTSGRGKNTGVKIEQEKKQAFYDTIKPLLSQIVDRSERIESGFMVAHTGYYFMQLLNYVFPFDPPFILSLAFKIVNCAAANGFTYNQSVLREIVKLTEMVLTDYKFLLNKGDSFANLITILDQFANSGWQEALELTWRLKEAF